MADLPAPALEMPFGMARAWRLPGEAPGERFAEGVLIELPLAAVLRGD